MKRAIWMAVAVVVALLALPGPARAQVAPTISTFARPSAVVGDSIFDQAFLTPPLGPPITGVVTFLLFGPNDPTCAAAPIFTNNVPVVPGNPAAVISDPFIPASPGSYQWVASYSGDANYLPVSTACGDPNETSVVTAAYPLAVSAGRPGAEVAAIAPDTAIPPKARAGFPLAAVGIVAVAILVQLGLCGAARRRRAGPG